MTDEELAEIRRRLKDVRRPMMRHGYGVYVDDGASDQGGDPPPLVATMEGPGPHYMAEGDLLVWGPEAIERLIAEVELQGKLLADKLAIDHPDIQTLLERAVRDTRLFCASVLREKAKQMRRGLPGKATIKASVYEQAWLLEEAANDLLRAEDKP
jgi:hypothetical protein